MADKVYPAFKGQVMRGTIDLEAVDLRIVLIDAADYTYNDAHDFLDDVPSGARVGTPQSLAGVTVDEATGVVDSDAATFTAVPAGDPLEAALIYIHNASEAAARLVCYRDSGSGLPVTPDGSDIIVTPHATNGWFKL